MRTALSAMIGILILFLFTLAPAVAQEGPDEQEPNDTMQDADSIDGFTIDGEVGRRTDQEDWYKLEGQEGTYPTIILSYDTDECDIDLDVYSDDELIGSLTGTEDEDYDSFEVPGTCYLRVYAYEGHGEYTIDIEAGDDGGGGHGEECQGDDEVESNDTMDLADTIDGYEIEGYACEDDDDWFILGGQEGRHPEFTLRWDEEECDIDMDIYSDDELIGSLTDTDSPDRDDFRVPGTCYLHVYAYDGEGDYTIEISED